MAQGKKAIKTLRKMGFKAKKGTMKLFQKSDRVKTSKSKSSSKKNKTLSRKNK